MSETYIVFPHDRLGPRISEYAAAPEQLSLASADIAQRTLQAAGIEPERVFTDSGAVDRGGNIVELTLESIAAGRDERAPRVLETLDAILIDDPTDEQLNRLREYGDVIENFEVPLVEPIETADSSGDERWHLEKINVAAAWSQGIKGNGVRIGILDTGIDASHPDFSGKSISFAEYDSNGFLVSTTPRDAGTHGTHVAGLAAGATYGVAPEADLAVAAVLTTKTNGGMAGNVAQILAGFNWLAHANHATTGISQCSVINASLGGSGYRDYLHSSVEVVRQVPGALLIAAIGNAGRRGVNNHSSPGNYDNVLGVGATDPADLSADFSDWGIETTHGVLKPDLSAPGVSVWSAVPGGGHAPKSGTSMASPLVAGAAALLVEKYPSDRRRPASLQVRLLRAVDLAPAADPRNTVSGYNKIGAGRLDLASI